MHIACGEQHELTTHTNAFDEQAYVVLLHGSRIAHRIPGAQKLLLLIVRYSKQGVDDERQLSLLLELRRHCCKRQFDVGSHPEWGEGDNVKPTVSLSWSQK